MSNQRSFKCEIKNGGWTRQSRETFSKNFDGLKDGGYKIMVERLDKKFSPSRYKYYFDYVMFTILSQAGDFLQIFDRDGKLKPVQSTDDVHAIMKATFNPITFVDVSTGLTGTIGKSTTDLSDRDFIGKFTEMIIAKFSSEPYYCDLSITYDDWKYFHEKKQWYRVKMLIKNGKEITQLNIDSYQD